MKTETECLWGEECEYVPGHEDEMDRKEIHKGRENEVTKKSLQQQILKGFSE